MIGNCPHCGIELKKPPFDNRETNEVVITLRYRYFLDNNRQIISIEKAGYCEICDARLESIKNQKRLLKN